MQSPDSQTKARELVSKYVHLLSQNNHYEFMLKIKSISNRKFQTKKYQDAEKILIVALETLHLSNGSDDNACLQLLKSLVQIYEVHPQILEGSKQEKLISILKLRKITNQQISLLTNMIRRIGEPSKVPILAEQIVKFKLSRQQFAAAEKLVANLSRELALNFLKEWSAHPQLNSEEKPAIWGRMILSRTITLGINEGMSILGEVPSEYRQDSYIIFSQQILQASKIKSCEAYDLISKSYSEFLESDFIYKGLYSSIGSKFFGKEAQKSGILGLLS